MIRSACWMARLTWTSPCMPGMPRWSGCDSGKPLIPSSVVITGNPGPLGQLPQLVVGAGQDDAVTGHDEGALGGGDEANGVFEGGQADRRTGGRLRCRGSVRRLEPPVRLSACPPVRLLLLHVLRNIHQHRPRAALLRHLERLAHRILQLLDVSRPGRLCLVIGWVMPMMSVSWNASRPIIARAT